MSNSFLDLNGLAHFKEKMDEQTNKQLANKANIDGYYETLAVGIAKNLEGRNDVTDSFMERTTGGDAEVANGAAQLMEVAGKSQVWNQLVQNGNFEDGTARWTTSGSAVISAANNVLTWTTADTASSQNLSGKVEFVNGHKYYLAFSIKGDTENKISGGLGQSGGGGLFVPINYSTAWKRIAKIVAPETVTSFYIYLRPNSDSLETQTTYFRNIIVLDLTLLGIDNLTTVEEVEAWLAKNICLREYYPYNAGTVLNSKMQGIESLGFNLLDPTTGKARIVGAYSDVYGNYYGITGTHGTLTFTSDLGETSEITPDTDGKFLLEEPGWLDVATPGADCAVFLWWDGTQTEYQPYERNTADLDVTHIYGKLNGTGELVQVFPDDMAGIGMAKDVLRIEDGVTVARKRVAYLLGSQLSFSKDADGIFKITGLPRPFGNGLYNVFCSKYCTYLNGHSTSSNIATLAAANDKTLFVNSGSANAYISDSAYTDITAFQTAIANEIFICQLATEQLYTDLVYQGSSLFADGTPVELPVNYRVNNWSIERMIPQNDTDNPTVVPPEVTIRYSMDAVEAINTLRDEVSNINEELQSYGPANYISAASMDDFLAVLSEQMGGTWTRTYNSTTQKHEFTFTPNE